MAGEIILTRDRSSGRVHKRMHDGDRMLADERCQTDQSGAFEIIEADALAECEPGALCLFCFSRADDEPVWA